MTPLLATLCFAFLLGITAGLRALTPIAAVSLASALGWLNLGGTPLAALGHRFAPCIAGLFALAELVGDKLPSTPSRKVPVQFATRILSGAVCGAALGFQAGVVLPASMAGALGAVIGTLGGAAARARLTRILGRGLPAALVEDAVAIATAALIVTRPWH